MGWAPMFKDAVPPGKYKISCEKTDWYRHNYLIPSTPQKRFITSNTLVPCTLFPKFDSGVKWGGQGRDALVITLQWGLPNKRIANDLDLQVILFSEKASSICLVHPTETSCTSKKNRAWEAEDERLDTSLNWSCKGKNIAAFHRNERCCLKETESHRCRKEDFYTHTPEVVTISKSNFPTTKTNESIRFVLVGVYE